MRIKEEKENSSSEQSYKWLYITCKSVILRACIVQFLLVKYLYNMSLQYYSNRWPVHFFSVLGICQKLVISFLRWNNRNNNSPSRANYASGEALSAIYILTHPFVTYEEIEAQSKEMTWPEAQSEQVAELRFKLRQCGPRDYVCWPLLPPEHSLLPTFF